MGNGILAFGAIKGLTGLKGPKGILADDFADCSDYAFAAPSIDFADCSDSAFAAKKIYSKRWSHCPETIVTIGTGTLSVAKEGSPKVDDRDVEHRRFQVFDLKDLSDLKDATPCSRGANVP